MYKIIDEDNIDGEWKGGNRECRGDLLSYLANYLKARENCSDCGNLKTWRVRF